MAEVNNTIRRLSELIANDPSNAELLVQRGYVWQDVKDLRRAMMDFQRAIDVDPFCVNALAASGSLRYMQGDYDGSIDDCSRAIGMEPENVMALCTRAAAYLKKDQ